MTIGDTSKTAFHSVKFVGTHFFYTVIEYTYNIVSKNRTNFRLRSSTSIQRYITENHTSVLCPFKPEKQFIHNIKAVICIVKDCQRQTVVLVVYVTWSNNPINARELNKL